MARKGVKAAVAMLVGISLLALVHARYRRDLDPARERIATGSMVVDTPCGPIEHAVAGEGPPVLIVHGAGGGYDQGRDFGEALVQHGFRVIAMSRFGYLRTPLPVDASAAAQADAHVCLLDALDIRRTAVIGVSAGAPSSMQLALRHPERTAALVLLVPAAYVPRPGQAPPMQTPSGTDFVFDTALKSDFLFWVAIRLARPSLIRTILATPPRWWQAQAPMSRRESRKCWTASFRSVRAGWACSTTPQSLRPYRATRLNASPCRRLRSASPTTCSEPSTAPATAPTTFRAPASIGYPSGGHLWVGHQNDVVLAIATFLK